LTDDPPLRVVIACVLGLLVAKESHASATTVILRQAGSGATADCRAHVTVEGGAELVRACGTPVLVTGSGAVGWVETDTTITPFVTDVSNGGEVRIAAAVPAGTVAFPGVMLGPGERIRLVSLSPLSKDNASGWLFVRDVTSTEAAPRMPVGLAVALLLDREDRVVGASRPIAVRAGATTDAAVVTHPEGAVLAAWLDRPPGTSANSRTSVAVAGEPRDRAPDAEVTAGNAIFAVWYGLEGSSARIAVDSDEVRLADDTVAIARGNVVLFRRQLRLLPALTVTIGAPPEDAVLPRTLTLSVARAVDEGKVLESRAVEAGHTYELGRLPAMPLVLDLRIGEFVLQKRANLSSGDDLTLSIPLSPVVVSGTVYAGGQPAQASVRFVQKGEPVVAETDDRGAYSVTLWEPRRYIVETVLADKPASPPFAQEVRIPSSGTLDIRIPANHLRVRVYDAADRHSVSGAQVMILNRWTGDSGSQSSVSSVTVNGASAELPPQHPGTVEITVRAAGYAPAEPLRLNVDDSTRDRTLDVPLTKSSRRAGRRIFLNGLPAAGAELATFADDRMVWHDTVDADGYVELPPSTAFMRIVARHPSAATLVFFTGPISDVDTLSLTPAAPPLLIRGVDRQGHPIGPAAAQVSIWLTGSVRLTGAEAAFATWSLAATAPDGTFLARGLGANPVRILVTRHATLPKIESGAFDALSKWIAYPWAAMADVTVAGD